MTAIAVRGSASEPPNATGRARWNRPAFGLLWRQPPCDVEKRWALVSPVQIEADGAVSRVAGARNRDS
jgi:hypothetical protein